MSDKACQKRIGLILGLMLSLSLGWAEAQTPAKDPLKIDPSELLEADPIGNQAPAEQQLQSEEADRQPPAKNPPASNYPIKPWRPLAPESAAQPFERKQSATEVISNADKIKATTLSPYYFSAYTAKQDQTEVDLGMILAPNPGIDVAMAWGVLNQLMATAKMSVQGASYTAGLSMQLGLRSEIKAETKPALAARLDWRLQNHRTNDDDRFTIFRGNRIQLSGLVSKDLGSLAAGLEADQAFINLLHYFRIHCEAIIEYQTGRINREEASLARIEIGLRGAVEVILHPQHARLIFNYHSLSDRLNKQDAYLGLRYYPREDFALDVLGGWFGYQNAVNISMAWFF